MEKEVLNFNSIAEYNEVLGVETLHPLVSIIDLSKAKPMRHMRHTFSFYSVYLKDEKNCDLLYGRRYYDYRKGSVLCMAPGQVIGVEDNGEEFQPKGWALLFHPDLIAGTPLNRLMKEYTFFSYESNEALHLSEREREVFMESLHKIQDEMEHSIDRFSKRLIASNIGLLLDYCLRFYERQFITRHEVNSDIISRFETLLSHYFEGGKARTDGIPSVKYCASELCLSPNYFGDLIKKETGRTPIETIQNKTVELAKGLLAEKEKSISEIAYTMGFQYPQHFTRIFKKVEGCSPNEYRMKMS